MSDKRKTITISVQDDFSKQLKTFARLLDESQGELTDLQRSTQRGGSGFSDMAEKVDHFTTALTNTVNIARSVIGTLNDMAIQGATIEKSAVAFDRLAGGAENANRWIQAIKEASRGSVTDFEATNQAIQLMTMGLADSADEAGRFMEIAAITAAINPELGTMENAITNIGLTLANDSWMRLDQLGVDATKAKARIEELKLEGMAMTEAFDVAVLEQLEANAETIGTDILEIGKNTAEMNKNWREAKEEASKFALVVMEDISPALSEAAVAAGQLFQIMTNLASGEWSLDLVLGAVQQEKQGWYTGIAGDLTSMFFGATGMMGGEPSSPNWNLQSQAAAGTAEFQAGMTAAFRDALGPWFLGQARIDTQQSQAVMMIATELPSFKGALESAAGIQVERGGRLAMPGTGDFVPGLTDLTTLPTTMQASQWGQQMTTQPGRMLQPGLGGETGAAISQMAQQLLMSQLETALGGGGGGPVALQLQGVKEAAVDMDALASATKAFADNAARVDEMRDISLSEKLGMGGATRLDTDVFSEVERALRGVETEGTAAADAIELYQLQTGLATGASEVFSGQMDTLAQRLADGELSAEEYVQKVLELSQMDMSQINEVISGLIDQGDITTAQQYIDIWSQLPDITSAAFGFGPQEDPSQTAAGFLDPLRAGGEEEDSPFQGLMDAASEMESTVTTAFENTGNVGMDQMAIIESEGAAAFGGLKTAALEDMQEMKDFINENFTGGQFVFTVTASVGDSSLGTTTIAPGGAQGIQQFQEGGFTGRGSSPFLAMLHPNEMVIPLSKMPMGQRGGDTVDVKLFIDGRQVEASVMNVKRLKNEAF